MKYNNLNALLIHWIHRPIKWKINPFYLGEGNKEEEENISDEKKG
uniref:Uncharacterized protein n=1 Tax=Tetranychus urticae TaxID=32264 RepID=T1L4E6_TETUR